MTVGHRHTREGRSSFRVFAPGKRSVRVVLLDRDETLALTPDERGHWTGETERLPAGALYWLEVDARRLPDPASRSQPQGVHGPSAVAVVEPASSPGWKGVAIEDAVIYELHVGTFTPAGTLAAARERLPHLEALGVNVVELLPLAAFPGERNWGYDGTYLFAIHAPYGTFDDLKAFVEAARARGIAVILDVVYNHFGPEGNYSGAFAPYTKSAATPWGAAINFDGPHSHGVRELFLENTRFWIEEVGLDGFRMDAVSLVFDDSPRNVLREITDLAHAIGTAQGRTVLMIAEHLRNETHVTAEDGLGYDAQWNDDLNHAIYAHLTGERSRHYASFGSFEDVVKAFEKAFVLDGTRFNPVHENYPGTDGSATHPREHVVHIQDHDQVGNRPLGDRMIATHGRAKALLGITAVLASPYVPMLFMGEEYGETAPFLFFEDFGDPSIVRNVREGRKKEFAFGKVALDDPHDRRTFEKSKLRWSHLETAEGRAILDHYRRLIALKRSGALGPRSRADLTVASDVARCVLTIETPRTRTVLNFSGEPRAVARPPGWRLLLSSVASSRADELAPFGAWVLERAPDVS